MAAKDYREVGHFPSTHWSLIFSAHEQDSVRRRGALEELLRLYLPALRAYLLYRRNIEPHRAEDLLQGFVADKILGRDLLAKFDAARGRFRSFLLKSLVNYVINERQREARRPGVDIDQEAAEGADDIFLVQWARQLLQETLRRMRKDCEKKGRLALWGLFECRVLGPTLTGIPPPSYDIIVQQFGFRSAEKACNALVTAKRQFERTLREVIAERENVTSDEDIEVEIADLCGILGSAGPLGVEYDRRLIAGPQPSGQENVGAVDESNPGELACLLSVRGTPEWNWQPAELGELLRHCLATSVGEYLKSIAHSPDFAADSPSECAAVGMTLGELFQSADPPLGLLIAVKRAARRLMNPGTSDMPVEVHHLIYLASIAAAMVRHGEKISKSSSEVLRVAWERLAEESYVDDWLRRLFATAVERLFDQGRS
ncbi:MAG: hypothetical protein ABSG53_07480 [Thermoguttaceae bacterium]|jgi:RNA polymerase sigma-70 factor (ECF subfamily)